MLLVLEHLLALVPLSFGVYSQAQLGWELQASLSLDVSKGKIGAAPLLVRCGQQGNRQHLKMQTNSNKNATGEENEEKNKS